MTYDSASFSTRSSSDLWSEICSNLPVSQEYERIDEQFTDSFQPHCPDNNQRTVTASSSTVSDPWEPMADSAVYIASLENRLKRIKGQTNDVTSREMLHSLSQAKKECWERFLHNAQTSELFQEGEIDQSALEHLKRWLAPERVAISAEELEFLLLPSQNRASDQPYITSQTTEESLSPKK